MQEQRGHPARCRSSSRASGNQRFAELWEAGAVGAHHEDHKIIDHPAVGPIGVDCDVMTDGDADRKIVVLTAAPGTKDETKLRLALVFGVAEPAGQSAANP
jgi:MmyB-like transcription regulator ligand binding domain